MSVTKHTLPINSSEGYRTHITNKVLQEREDRLNKGRQFATANEAKQQEYNLSRLKERF